MNHRLSHSEPQGVSQGASGKPVYWRVEGSLLNLSAVRPVAFFTWNAQSFTERWIRRGLLFVSALFRPLLYAGSRSFATRLLHLLLRGISRDRLDLLGEEYFQYNMQPHLRAQGIECLKQRLSLGERIVLVSQGLEHVMRPLAVHLGVKELLANRLDFRDGLATGRLVGPVVRPRGLFARIRRRKPDGRLTDEELHRDLGFPFELPELLECSIPARRDTGLISYPAVDFSAGGSPDPFSVKGNLAGKNILLIGVTGFIGKVWLVQLLEDLPEIGKIYLLIRRQRSASALRRFEKMVEESPVFDSLFEKYGESLPAFLQQKIEILEGDLTREDLGLSEDRQQTLIRDLDLIVNSSGLTDFNPDLRSALSANVEAPLRAVEFLRRCRRAGLMHLSTCFVAGMKNGRIAEISERNYTPKVMPEFDVEQELKDVYSRITDLEGQADGEAATREIIEQLKERKTGEAALEGSALEVQLRKGRQRWFRQKLVDLGLQRAQHWGWPNIYTYTKSLAESLIAERAPDLPIAVVRPSIVETSTGQPFSGWNEGVNTSAPLSYLLGTYFRQLPSDENKCLDMVPVDLVCRGMTLIAAALVTRCHQRVYQLASSAKNPCNMRRSIELTGLAHRKHYRAQEGLEYWLRARFDTISVSKTRYQVLSVPRQKALIRSVRHLSQAVPSLQKSLIRKERGLERVEAIVELYEPFILHNQHIFESDHVEFLSAALPAEERQAFLYDVYGFDWWDYWINIHVPALRKWCYPLIEQRPLEHRRNRSFRLDAEPGGESLPSPARTPSEGPSPL